MNWLNDNVNLLSLIGAAAILIITVVVVGKYIKQMKSDVSTGELTDENWDGIGEYKNNVPMGWALAFIGAIIWAIWYMLFGYPVNAYSQIGEYNNEVKTYNAQFESKWANPDEKTLLAMGEGVFFVQCAACHGITGDGTNGKAADFATWGKEEAIVNTILHGAKGSNYPLGEMPAGLLDKESAKAVAAYVIEKIAKNGKSKNHDLVATGEALWVTCAACHGADGSGLGGSTPDLEHYGKAQFVVNVLNRGKKGFIGDMPKFNDGRLSEVQKLAVGKYITAITE